ncbi:Mu transposase C-terminal domain-containing protein [Caulobacter sp. Root487D2Y]|uniref:Mu transposase C-terminal domain-containing protein n=1 Tax=Caulobacter sp. Root487D2Y TaxID=1736547 RepID=UPI0009E83B90|nr:DDE-type integrase/transposase/recombinase [Caulobacter sp. Root487D2Y]
MSRHHPAADAVLDGISDQKFEELALRLKLIQNLPPEGKRTREHVEIAAECAGVHPATLYRSMARIEGNGTVRDLSPRGRGYPKGRSRLHPRQEALIQKFLRVEYLTFAKPSLQQIADRIGDACEDEGLSRPTRAAINRRLKAFPKRSVVLRRQGAKVAEQHTPRPGQYVVEHPWDVWQIDHTLADVIVVDVHGRPIGRPWLTVVVDVCTRLVVSFYVGLDPPSTIRVASTLDLAVSSKAAWLAARGLDYPWPVEGLPRLLHSDNAKEFTRDDLRRAFLNHGVDWSLRPLGGARYGGHVERLIGTLMGGCRVLPGATHNSPAARGGYDSKGAARLRIDDLEMYFAHQILGVYNQTDHSALGVSPLRAWTERVDGLVPVFPDDLEAFRLDLFPQVERTVGRQGIKAFGDDYYCQKLGEAYICGLRNIVAKYDPRDLSRLYVKLPDAGYIPVPYRLRRDEPPPTLWLLKAAARSAVKPNVPGRRDRAVVRQAVRAMEATIEQAASRSGAAARQVERLRIDRRTTTVPPDPKGLIQGDDDWGGAFKGRGA